jgi:hypothetical protein
MRSSSSNTRNSSTPVRVRRGPQGRGRRGVAGRPAKPRQRGAASGGGTPLRVRCRPGLQGCDGGPPGVKDIPEKSWVDAQERLDLGRDFSGTSRRRLHHRTAFSAIMAAGGVSLTGLHTPHQVLRRERDRPGRARYGSDSTWVRTRFGAPYPLHRCGLGGSGRHHQPRSLSPDDLARQRGLRDLRAASAKELERKCRGPSAISR